jgi:hypothetical protein
LLVLQSDWLVANVWAIGMSVETDASGPYWLCKSSTSCWRFSPMAQWMQGEFRDGNGNRCLFDALHQLRRKHGIRGDGTGYYLRDAMPRRRELAWFNDDCKNFGELPRC